MRISFEEYCEDFLDQHIGLMSDDDLKKARKAYNDLTRIRKTPAQIAKHEKALAKAKESRKLAKFYGGKALTGSAKQKKWAESIRQKVLESSALSDDEKTELVKFSGITNTSKFWINNRDKSPSLFKVEIISSEINRLNELYDKHYDALVRGARYKKDLARKKIYEALSSQIISVTCEFPYCEDFYDAFGNLKKGLKFRC